MTGRTAQGWSAVMVVAGGLLAATAVLRAGPPAPLWAARAAALTAYGGLAALTLGWGQAVYGAPGAVGAVGLLAFAPPALAGAAACPLLAALAQLAAAYALMRCLLDPSVQWALFSGLAIAAALPAAGLCGQWLPWAAACMAGFSVLLVAARVLTAERWEPRARVARAGVVSVGLAWAVAALLALALTRLSSLPSPGEYGRAGQPLPPFPAVRAAAAASAAHDGTVPSELPIVLLLLAALRPWRRQRRYTDATWLLALLCLAVPLWRAAVAWPNNLVAVVPILALLAGACWDAARPPWLRRAATAAVVLHAAAAVLLWPHYATSSRGAEAVPRLAAARPQRGPA